MNASIDACDAAVFARAAVRAKRVFAHRRAWRSATVVDMTRARVRARAPAEPRVRVRVARVFAIYIHRGFRLLYIWFGFYRIVGIRRRARCMPSFAGVGAGDVGDAATAFLTALDTSLARAWREEDRQWRKEERQWRREDLEFRVEERDWWELEHVHRDEQRKWRRQDVEQRVLENARWVWNRYAEKNRRDVEEKGEQLRTTSNLSALISGFAVVALVELQFSDPTVKAFQSEALIAAYAGATAVTVALMLNAMVLCSFMLSNILRNGKSYVSEDEEAEFLYACRKFALSYAPGDTPPQPQRSFERYWETRCEADWRKAFRMFTYGVPMFLTTLTLSAWLKFWYSTVTCSIVTGVAAVAIGLWWRTQSAWGWHLMKRSEQQFSKSRYFPPEGLPFDWHARPRKKPTDSDLGSMRNNSGASDEDFFAASPSVSRSESLSRAEPPSDASAARVDASTIAHQNGTTTKQNASGAKRDPYAGLKIDTRLRAVAVEAVSDREREFLRDSSPRAIETTKREYEKVGLKSKLVDQRAGAS